MGVSATPSAVIAFLKQLRNGALCSQDHRIDFNIVSLLPKVLTKKVMVLLIGAVFVAVSCISYEIYLHTIHLLLWYVLRALSAIYCSAHHGLIFFSYHVKYHYQAAS